jgi:hypothetical protein
MTSSGIGPEGVPAQGRDPLSPLSPLSPFSPLNFGEFVRRALHAAVEQIEPGGDGLAPIWARILAGGE